MYRLMMVVMCLVVLASIGCVTRGTMTEGDREVVNQTSQAVGEAVQMVGAALAAVPAGGDAATLLASTVIRLKVADENLKQQIGVHGDAKAPVPFSPEASKAARDKSTQEHSSSAKVWGILGAVAGVGVSLMGMPWLARVFPVLTGPVGRIAQAGLQSILFARKKAEENGGSLSAAELLQIAKDENVLAGVQDLVAAKAKKLEEKLGCDFKLNLKSDEAEVKPA